LRGELSGQDDVFSYVPLEKRIPSDHPLRGIRAIVDKALKELSEVFDEMYAKAGRRSIPPEQLIRALLLQILFSIRSERQLMEQLDYNLLFRWFVGLRMDEVVWNHSTFSKNRDRLLLHDVAERFFESIRGQADAARLLSREHFTVDGTLIEASASLKSFRPRVQPDHKSDPDEPDDPDHQSGSRNVERDFKGEKRSNETHSSRTDPDARLARKGKGKEARLSYAGHLVTENRHGLIVEAQLSRATGRAERETALRLLSKIDGTRRVTVGADKGYDTGDFVEGCRELDVTPHVAQKKFTWIDGRTTRHPGYLQSCKRRKMVEERFGWMKDIGLLRKLRHRGLNKVGWIFKFTASVCNMVMMNKLIHT
jgi:transposase